MAQNLTNLYTPDGQSESDHNWWEKLSTEEIQGIERGLRDIELGRVVSHEIVKLKFGL